MKTKTIYAYLREISLFALLTLLMLQSIDTKAQCCMYRLNMQDSYGDGWNGATLEVFVNNNSVGVFSAANYGSIDSFQVCNGDSVRLFYTAGSYENENSYQLYNPFYTLAFADSPNPQTGTVSSFLGDCSGSFLAGNNPCTALPIDTGQCVIADNSGFSGSGLSPGCANYQGGDVWFSMQVPPSGNLSFVTDSGGINDTGLALWASNGNCGALRLLDCDDDSGNGYFSFLSAGDLTPNQTIYIQVFGYGGATGDFRLCINDLGTVSLDSSELPLVFINTQGQTIVPDTKINCRMEVKYYGPNRLTYFNDVANVYSGNIGVEIRGATSAGYPQFPMGFETRDATGANLNVSMLGMPAENDWVLLSNYNDRSLIRNTLAYKLFSDMGHYSVRTSLCEVLIDSAYRGIYVFAEKIKRDNNRLDIANLTLVDTTGDELSGGYILQQNIWDASNSFQSNYSPIDHPGFDVHFVYEYPKSDVILPVQKNYIANYVDSLEDALYSTNFADSLNGYRKYMDVKSFIDYFLVNELARNADGFKKSVFFHKDKYSNGGKFKAGPVWDFDWAWKNIAGCSLYDNFDGAGWAHLNNDCPTDNYSTGWSVRLLQDSFFRNELRCTYEDYRQTILDTSYLFAYIDSVGTLVQNAQARHFQKWPILGISGPAPEIGAIATTYQAELDTLKAWIATRLQWMDANMPGLCWPTPVANELVATVDAPALNCFPNPATDLVQVEYTLATAANVKISLRNYLGAELLSLERGNEEAGLHSLSLDTARLPAGTYILSLEAAGWISNKKLVIVR